MKAPRLLRHLAHSVILSLSKDGERAEFGGVVAQYAIDRSGRKSEALEAACRRWIRNRWTLVQQSLEGGDAARALVRFERRYRLGSGIAVDTLANQLADEPVVADRLPLSLDVESRVEAIVEESVALAPLDRVTRALVVETLALQVLPEPCFGAPLPREKRQRRTKGSHSIATAAGALPLLEAVLPKASRIFASISTARSACSSKKALAFSRP